MTENSTHHAARFNSNNRVVGIIDAPENAQAAVETFRENGFDDAKLEVLVGAESARMLNLEESGEQDTLTNLTETVQKSSSEVLDILKIHAAELESGKTFFAVESDGTDAQIKQISDILAGNLAHDVYFFGGSGSGTNVQRLSATTDAHPDQPISAT